MDTNYDLRSSLNKFQFQTSKLNVKTAEQAESAHLLDRVTLDSISFSKSQAKSTESYSDVLEEFRNKYGEGRSLEQAKLGVEYMTRVLACDDLPAEARAYYETEKVCYEMMVTEFENWDKARGNGGEKFDDVMKEMEEFIAKYKQELTDTSDMNQLSYQHEYVQAIYTFYERMFKCSDLTPELNTEVESWVKDYVVDFNYLCNKIRVSNNPQGEKFEDVLNELRENVPDRTTTIKEKELAVSYIDRMTACSDITPELKEYWENKKEIIEMEIQDIKNEQMEGSGESLSNVWEEFSAFGNKYFTSLFDRKGLSMDDKFENRMTYYRTYLSFCRRALSCSDITPQERAEYQRMIENAQRDIKNWQKDYYDSLL